MNFFNFSQGNLGNLVGNLAGFCGFLLSESSKIRGNFGAFFVRKFVAHTKIFRAKFTLQTCHLKNHYGDSGLIRRSIFNAAGSFGHPRKIAAYPVGALSNCRHQLKSIVGETMHSILWCSDSCQPPFSTRLAFFFSGSGGSPSEGGQP